MKLALSLPLFATLATFVFGDVIKPEKRIVGGVEAPQDRFPYMVALINADNTQYCGGALIAPNWVLSAAHCRSLGASVIISRSNLGQTFESFERIYIDYEVRHPEYNQFTNEHDILLIKLVEESTTTPVKYDDGTYDLNSGFAVTVMGFGTTCSGGSQSNKLLEAQVNIVDNSLCNSKYSSAVVTSDMVCAAAPGKDACQGDSGGPLVIKGNSATDDVLVGVVSWGTGCAEPDFPGVYSRTASHTDWIQSVTSGTRAFTSTERIKYNLSVTAKRIIRDWRKETQQKQYGLRNFERV